MPKFVSYSEHQEHEFEKYQRIFIVLQHALFCLRLNNYQSGVGSGIKAHQKQGVDVAAHDITQLRELFDKSYFEDASYSCPPDPNETPSWMKTPCEYPETIPSDRQTKTIGKLSDPPASSREAGNASFEQMKARFEHEAVAREASLLVGCYGLGQG